jgi:hypothetical protein
MHTNCNLACHKLCRSNGRGTECTSLHLLPPSVSPGGAPSERTTEVYVLVCHRNLCIPSRLHMCWFVIGTYAFHHGCMPASAACKVPIGAHQMPSGILNTILWQIHSLIVTGKQRLAVFAVARPASLFSPVGVPSKWLAHGIFSSSNRGLLSRHTKMLGGTRHVTLSSMRAM